jgi:hypothetical protein
MATETTMPRVAAELLELARALAPHADPVALRAAVHRVGRAGPVRRRGPARVAGLLRPARRQHQRGRSRRPASPAAALRPAPGFAED